MKKFFNTIIILALILIISPVAQAASASFNIRQHGQNTVVYKANVLINSVQLQSNFSPYVKDGRTFVPIREITESMGAKVIWNDKTKSCEVILNNQTVKLKIDSNVIFINGEKKTLDDSSIPRLSTFSKPVYETKTMVPLRFLTESFGFNVGWEDSTRTASISNFAEAATAVQEQKPAPEQVVAVNPMPTEEPVLNPTVPVANSQGNRTEKDAQVVNPAPVAEPAPVEEKTNNVKSDGKITIVLDAGHGGKDSGATAKSDDILVKEKELNLKIVKALEPMLKAKGYEVILTRDRDEYVALLNRTKEANAIKAEVFVSIHFNAASSKSANGIEVLYASENKVDRKSVPQKPLAQCILDEVLKTTGANNRGIKNRPDLVVLNSTDMAAALAELGFMSNASELNDIMQPEYMDKLALGVYNGIVKYVDNYID